MTGQPFSMQYTRNVPQLLHDLECSLAITTYQAGKLIFISPTADNRLVQLPRTFSKPMGVGLSSDMQSLALATLDQVVVFQNSPELAYHYPRKPQTYDALFLPRLVYLTNALDIHDLEWVGDDLIAVNTLFSCIMKLSRRHNFEIIWKPPMIDRIASEDRCHLNGMAVENGSVKYATAFSETNTPRGWRDVIPHSGVIFDTQTDEILTRGLAMPHSPKLIGGRLILLLSATGQVMEVDRSSGHTTEVCRVPGFVRGMAYHADHLFVGHSRLRENSSSFGKLQLPYGHSPPGITIVHLPTGTVKGSIHYESSVEEIYEVRIMDKLKRPNILNTSREDYKLAISTPERTYWARPENSSHADTKPPFRRQTPPTQAS